MIERIVLIKLHDEHANDATRAEVAEYSRQVLPSIPGLKNVAVGLPADEQSAASWDIEILAHFDSVDDIAPYLAHPDHRAYVDDYLQPKMACIKAWNFTR